MTHEGSLPESQPSTLPIYRRQASSNTLQLALAIPSNTTVMGNSVIDLWVIITANKTTDELTCSIRPVLPKDFPIGQS